jgi:hypothetical protein
MIAQRKRAKKLRLLNLLQETTFDGTLKIDA